MLVAISNSYFAKGIKFLFQLVLSLAFLIIITMQFRQLNKSEKLTISSFVDLPDDITKFTITICPHQSGRMKNGSTDNLGPGYINHYEWAFIHENDTYGDAMKFLKPPEELFAEITFGLGEPL